MYLFVPLWLVFEIAQLVASQRYLGTLTAGSSPMGPRESVAFVWSATLILYYAWMLLMLFHSGTRMQIATMIFVSAGGFMLRRLAPQRRVFPLFAFESALRIGLLLSLFA